MAAWLWTALLAGSLHAQTVPTGQQEYFILGRERHIWDMMQKVLAGQGGAIGNSMNVVVTATASADNQVVYYDHWEDGLEADIENPGQLSTLIIGDGDPMNGDACDFNADPCGVDSLLGGDYVNFASNAGELVGCTVPSASPLFFTELCSSVPVNPVRCAVAGACTDSEVRFDGGDRIFTTGGPLSLVHSEDPLSQFIGGSTEMLSRQAVEAARSYSIPVGEDLYPDFGCPNCVMEPFHYVDLNLVAFEDGTNVTVTSPGAGTVSFTLNRGEHWSSLGLIDDTTPAPALTINAGTKVSTSGPITGMIFTGGDGQWATRHYTLLPDILHSTDYVITAPGDDPAVGPSITNRPLNLYILNADPLNAITVSVTDSLGTNTINIPANSMVDYFTGTGRFVPNGSTVRLTSDRPFWGVSGYDYNTNISDWGHSWLATRFLAQNYTVSHAPGDVTVPPDQNLSPVYVAAVQNNTRVQIDFDNDGAFDVVDLNGDGVPDAAPLPNNTYLVNALGALSIFDPNDFNNTGTRVVSNKPVAVAWGQETDLTGYGDDALDTGYTVYPTSQLFLDPVLVVDKQVNVSSVPMAGGVATYTITVSSYEFGPLTNVLVYDLLPAGVTSANYVPGSTLITYPDLIQSNADPALGGNRLDWTLSPNTLGTNQTLTVRYSIAIPPAPGGLPRLLTNEAHAQGTLGGSIYSPFDTADVVQTDITLNKSVDVTSPAAGDFITFTLNVANGGITTETNAFITDAIPPNTTFVGSITDSGPFALSGVYDAGQNAVVWSAANFPPGGPWPLSFQVRVNPGAPEGTEIPNRGGYESNETPYFLSNEVEPIVTGPELVLAKSGPALLHPDAVATFVITVDNVGASAATSLRIVDPFPTNATYVSGSMEWQRNVDPLASVTDAADADEGTAFADRLELIVASLGPGEDLTFRFQVQVNPGTAGQFVTNQATVASVETLPADTNLVQIPVVEPDITGHVFLDYDGDGVQDPGEPDLANVDVVVTDGTGATQTVSTDANGDYRATIAFSCYEDELTNVAYNGSDGTLDWTAAGYQWTEFSTDAGHVDQVPTTLPLLVEADPLGVFGNSLLIEGGSPNGNVAVRGFTRQVNLSAAAGFGTAAVLAFDYRRVSLEAADFVTVEIDYDDDGVFDFLASYGNGADAAWQNASFTLDAAQLPDDPVVLRFITTNFNWFNDNFYVDNVRICNSAVTADVDETDPDFPTGAVLTTANDPQTVAAVPGSTVAATPVGYQPPPLGLTKASDAPNSQVVAGQTITYTLTLTNNSGVTQNDVAITDAVPTGTSSVPGSTLVTRRAPQFSTSVSLGTDDAEQNAGTGAMNLGSGDLDIVFTGGTQQIIGTRFQNVAIPPGASILSAEIEFDPDGSNATTTNVSVLGQASLNAGTFTGVAGNISGRPRTAASVGWNVPAWVNAAGNRYQTPDLSSIVQEIVNQGGWASGNAMAFFIEAAAGCVDTDCDRQAETFEGTGVPALLRIDYGLPAVAGGDPANLVVPADNYDLAPGETITVTFQVVADSPIPAGVNQIVNSAAASSNEQPGPFNASVTDNVVRPAVTVEYNNAGFALAGSTRTFSHEVVNRGTHDDSFEMSVTSELGWMVELIDPDTGAVIATDTDGDGTWDAGGPVNTGILAPGESASYDVRVTVPGGTPVGTEETTNLIATSDRDPNVSAAATDEILVIDTTDVGPVILIPDNSGVVTAGGSIAYTHRVINNTGAADTFDLSAFPTLAGWTATIYFDNNGDGVYTPGIDIAITNTAQLADGESQIIFVVIDAPGGASAGDTDVTHITATSRNDTDQFDAATDTTTVLPATTHDLSGGGTLLVDGGDTAVHPGTLRNLQGVADVFELNITASPYLGVDGLNHPTQLLIDTDADGVPDTQIAEDTDGDGTWDTILAGYDTNSDNEPDVAVAARTTLAYELRRAIDPIQPAMRDVITLSATSRSTGEVDSVTSTDLLAAATQAVLASFEASNVGGSVVLEWRTASEMGTLGFHLFRKDEGERRYRRVNPKLLRGLLNAPQGGVYRYLDKTAKLERTYSYRLVEIEAWGTRRDLGRFTVWVEATPTSNEGEKTGSRPARLTPGVTLVRAGPLESSAPEEESGGLVGKREPEKVGAESDAPVATGNEDGPATTATAQELGEDAAAEDYSFEPNRSALRRRPKVRPDPGRRDRRGGPRLRLTLRETGLVRVSAGELASALDTPVAEVSSWIRQGRLKLDSQGEVVAWMPAAQADGIYFYGEAIDSIYTDRNVYWIEKDRGRTMRRSRGGPVTPQPGGSFVEHLHFEEEAWPTTSVLTDPESDFWFWDFFYAGIPGYESKTFSLTVPGVAPSSSQAQISLALQGGLDSPDVDPDHHVTVSLNGTPIGESRWEGNAAHRVELSFDQGLLSDGTNSLEITALAEAGMPYDLFYLDSVDVTYARLYRAAQDRLLASAGERDVITIEGFTRPDIAVFEVSDPRRPRVVRGQRVDEVSSGYRVSFRVRGSKYLATPLDNAGAPPSLEADEASQLRRRKNRADWIVIAPAGFEAAAGELATHRGDQGLETLVIRLQDVYDEFNHGIASPWAIRDFLAHTQVRWALAPRYVVLAGDGSLDYKDHMGAGGNLIPSLMVSTPEGLLSSDHRLADLVGDDGVPEIAIGRLPVQEPAELSAYVAKLQARDAAGGPWRNQTLWVADDPDHGGEFVDDSEALIVGFAPSFEIQRIYLTELGTAETRTRITDGLASGAAMVNYLGHGGLDRLADEGLVVTGDVAGLDNGPRFPILTAFTCSVGRFALPGFDTLGEALILQDDGGAIAVLAPSGLSMNEGAVLVGAEVVRALSHGHTLGDALRRGLRDYVEGGGDEAHLPFIYGILGDPAVELGPEAP